ncbi:hypothetical protein [Williamsia sp. 1135]|uniref:hypothetical protein n=1 Tax=Williamsia sp. 1135 TaxID=1889262 RepID=UPI000A0F7F1D|nr:hypothetical protein [Williamsia sp. 1135]ORM37649.1 hypothetical protein BFL43_03525 [Williamsia sp. 1135]
MKYGLREALWSVGVILIVVVRVVTTLSTALLVMGWVVVAFRSDLLNGWLWPAVISVVLLAGSTLLYNVARG